MKTIAFVCIGNSCRSQIAEGFAKYYGKGNIVIYSAGTEPANQINPLALVVMKEKDIDISGQFPKKLDLLPSKIDYLITMGCGVECPFLIATYYEDWSLDDPAGKSIDFFRFIRDEIEKKVLDLLSRVS